MREDSLPILLTAVADGSAVMLIVSGVAWYGHVQTISRGKCVVIGKPAGSAAERTQVEFAFESIEDVAQVIDSNYDTQVPAPSGHENDELNQISRKLLSLIDNTPNGTARAALQQAQQAVMKAEQTVSRPFRSGQPHVGGPGAAVSPPAPRGKPSWISGYAFSEVGSHTAELAKLLRLSEDGMLRSLMSPQSSPKSPNQEPPHGSEQRAGLSSGGAVEARYLGSPVYHFDGDGNYSRGYRRGQQGFILDGAGGTAKRVPDEHITLDGTLPGDSGQGDPDAGGPGRPRLTGPTPTSTHHDEIESE